MSRIFLFIFLSLVLSIPLKAQELNARVTVNTSKIEAANQDLFSQFEKSVNQFFNEQKWTDATFVRRERIDCTINIILNEKLSENNYIADIQITSRRPVYNSSYITSLLNYKDAHFEFSYYQGQSLDYNRMNVDNNLVATLAYYAYIIIGFDFDSFSLNGGQPYFKRAMDIANMAQGLNAKGWEPFSGKNSNRYDLAIALTEESSQNFHTVWYTYHRMGLDEMAANPSRGRIRIIESIDDLKKLYDARPSSPLLTIFSESKLDELINVASDATLEEKQNLKKILNQLFPTKGNIINTLR